MFWVKLLRIFSAWEKCVFTGGFGEIVLLDVVFLWTACGGLCGEDGLRMCCFWGVIFLQFFGIYFWVDSFGNASE